MSKSKYLPLCAAIGIVALVALIIGIVLLLKKQPASPAPTRTNLSLVRAAAGSPLAHSVAALGPSVIDPVAAASSIPMAPASVAFTTEPNGHISDTELTAVTPPDRVPAWRNWERWYPRDVLFPNTYGEFFFPQKTGYYLNDFIW